MKKEKILITGGLGFIGTNLARFLLAKARYDLTILDKEGTDSTLFPKELVGSVEIINGDVTKNRLVGDVVKGKDIVVHLAAETHTGKATDNPYQAIYPNVIGTVRLLEAACKFGIRRFIYPSSSEVYGNKVEGLEMDENHPLNPVTPYAASKLAAERIVMSFFYTKNLPVSVLRFFNIYGPYQKPIKMIPKFITRLIKDQPVVLSHAGKPVRDWVYVDDCVRAIWRFLTVPEGKVNGQIFNIGTGKASSISEVTRIILRILGKNENLVEYAKFTPPETMENVGVSKKAKKILGWEAKISLEEGIRRTVEWYKKILA